MSTRNKIFSLDNEACEYIETIVKSKRSETIRQALKLHKKQNGIVKNTQISKKEPKMEVIYL